MIWIKWVVGVGVVTLVWLTAYNAGQDSIRSDLLADYQQRQAASMSEFTDIVEKREAERDNALAVVDQLRNRPPEVVTNEVIKVVERSVCKRLDVDVVGLLNGHNGQSTTQ
jgi:hypothetical protein